MKELNSILRGLLLLYGCFLLGCDTQTPSSPNYGYDSPGEIRFKDEVKTNSEVIEDITALEFVDTDGLTVQLKDLTGLKNNTVVVVTRGHTKSICVFCSAQTSRLIKRYDEFEGLDTEVVLVYPVEAKENAETVKGLLESARQELDDSSKEVPFPVLVDLELNAVNKLGIRESLSKPATYVLDKDGKVRFAYVGKAANDRPSIDAVLMQLQQLQTD